jgi:hypothetical protein
VFNPREPDDLKKLGKAIKGSRESMKVFYDNRNTFYTELVGKHYSDDGTSTERPLNQIELAWSIYKSKLIASAPQINVTTRVRDWQADAMSFELAVNQYLRENDLRSELELWIMEAMFSPMGVMKLAMDLSDSVDMDGMRVVGGVPQCTAIMFDDWVQDMTAKKPESVAFCGDRYYVTDEFAIEHFDPELVKQLKVEGSGYDGTSTGMVSQETIRRSDYRKMREVWDIWMPDEGLVLTLGGEFDVLLRVVEWTGPKRGPYTRLYFGPVPGSSLPLPPVAMWLPMHKDINNIANKLGDQSDRQKTVVGVQSAHKDDGESLKNAQDGEAIVLQSLEAAKELRYGGIDNSNFAYMLQLMQLFSKHGGNLDVMGGLSPMTSTVGQESLLSEAASERVKQMQNRVYASMQPLCEDICEYFMSDPTLEVPITKPIPGTNESVETVWRRDEMRGDRSQYQAIIEPHSMQRRTPLERLAQVQDYWDRMVNSLPLYQARGMSPNVEALHKIYIKLADLPELADLIIYTQGETMPSPEDAGMPKQTKRTYERVNRGSATQSGQEQRLIQSLMGAGQQASESAIGVPG